MKTMSAEMMDFAPSNKNEDQRIMAIVRSICEQGRNAEIKQNRDGTLKVYDVTKHIVG